MILRQPNGEHEFVSKGERATDEKGKPIVDPELRTRLLYRDLTELERIECYDLLKPRSLQDRSRGELWFVRAVLQRAFLGASETHPFRDQDWNPVPFEVKREKGTGFVSDETFGLIEPGVRSELAMAIWERTALTEDELGKFEPSPGGLPERSSPDDPKTTLNGAQETAAV